MIRRGRLLLAVATFLLVAQVAAQGVTLPDYTRTELDNGVVLILVEKHDVPLIGIQAVLRGGAVSDPDGLNGLSSLLAGLLEKGAGDRDAASFAEAIAAVGGRLSASGSLETITVSGDFLARDADLMIALLADMLQRPALAAGEMRKLRDRSINLIRAAKDSNFGALVAVYGGAFLFGDHPYGNPVSGSEATLATITHADLLAYYEDHVGADRLVIAVAGDFDAAVMRQALESAFGGWRPARATPVSVPDALPQIDRRVLLVDKPGAAQTYFWIGNVGVANNYAHRAALDVANTVYGGRFTSMLNTELRIKSGLTYGARSSLRRPSRPGSVAISSYTQAATTTEAIDMALGVLGQLRDAGLGEEMILSARNYVLGQFPTKLETAAQLAALFARIETFDLGPSYINEYGASITTADAAKISAVIDAVYPSLDNLVFVLLGDAKLIRESVGKYGPVTELAITEPRFRP